MPDMDELRDVVVRVNSRVLPGTKPGDLRTVTLTPHVQALIDRGRLTLLSDEDGAGAPDADEVDDDSDDTPETLLGVPEPADEDDTDSDG